MAVRDPREGSTRFGSSSRFDYIYKTIYIYVFTFCNGFCSILHRVSFVLVSVLVIWVLVFAVIVVVLVLMLVLAVSCFIVHCCRCYGSLVWFLLDVCVVFAFLVFDMCSPFLFVLVNQMSSRWKTCGFAGADGSTYRPPSQQESLSRGR